MCLHQSCKSMPKQVSSSLTTWCPFFCLCFPHLSLFAHVHYCTKKKLNRSYDCQSSFNSCLLVFFFWKIPGNFRRFISLASKCVPHVAAIKDAEGKNLLHTACAGKEPVCVCGSGNEREEKKNQRARGTRSTITRVITHICCHCRATFRLLNFWWQTNA